MAAPTGQALIVVDVQRDFCTGGSLAVPNGNAVIPPLNDTLRRCHAAGSPVYASRDWHPAVTRHFKDHGGPWPPSLRCRHRRCGVSSRSAACRRYDHREQGADIDGARVLGFRGDDTVGSIATRGPRAAGHSASVGRGPGDRLLRAANGARCAGTQVTRHFKDHGGPWPPHCVAGTVGAEFHPDLQLAAGTIIVSKGQTSTAHGYSVFEGTIPSGASLPADLERRGIRRLLVGGLATDYCVRQTVLDALQAGFDVVVATDAVAGVDLEPGDSTRALDDMRAAGAEIRTSFAGLVQS